MTMSFRTTHWLAPGLVAETRVAAKGRGVYTTRPIERGETVTVWGGDILNREQLDQCSEEHQMHAVQVWEGLYLTPHREAEDGDCFNHSCDPNVGVRGQNVLQAMRDIEANEELCFDYATTDSSDYDEFQCACGTASCRGTVRGDDWKRADLRERYRGWFSLYLQQRIDRER
jgi:hypothetical protein